MPVELSFRDDVALITLNRPEALNALSHQILEEISASVEEVRTSDARAMLITGAGGKAFCAGADIKELTDNSPLQHRSLMERGQGIYNRIAALHIPSIAVINGYAFGGGLELALACDFRLATANAKLGLPEIKLGLVPGYGGTQRLPRLIGESRALEIILTGRTLGAEEAMSIGLVNQLIEGEAVEAGIAFAKTFTQFSLTTLRLARSAVHRAMDVPLSEGLELEADIGALAFQTADGKEGMTAFQEKRPAAFKDR